MKRLLSGALALFLLASCSSDDENSTTSSIHGNPDPNTVLVKKIIETFPTGYERTSTYVYDGVRVTKILKSDGAVIDYIYNPQGQITKINSYTGMSLYRTELLTYNTNGQVQTYVTVYAGGNYSTRTEYIYNTNGTIQAETFTGDFMSADQHFNNTVITMDGNNITSVVKTFESYADNFEYTFDSNNSFDKNIAARDVLSLIHENGGTSNKLTFIYTSQDYMGTREIENSTIIHTYNNDYYPVTSTETTAGNDVITTQYFYE